MASAKRTTVLVLFVFAAMVIGLAAGTVIGGMYFVPAGSGLAGPVIALGYGVLGAVIALVAALVTIKFVPQRWQMRAAVPVLLVGLVMTILIARGVMQSRAATEAFMADAYENMNRFDVTLRYEPASGPVPFRELRLDWNARTLAVSYGDDASRSCTAPVPPVQAAPMLRALRDVEGLLYRDEFPCAGSLGSPERYLEFTIIEAMPPNNSGDLAITAACAAEHPELSVPFTVAETLLASGEVALPCSE